MEEIVGYFYDPLPTYFGDRKKQSLFDKSSHKKFNSDLPDIPVTALCLGAFFLQVICVFQSGHPERTEENKIAYENFLETLEKVHQSAPLLDYESNEKAQWERKIAERKFAKTAYRWNKRLNLRASKMDKKAPSIREQTKNLLSSRPQQPFSFVAAIFQMVAITLLAFSVYAQIYSTEGAMHSWFELSNVNTLWIIFLAKEAFFITVPLFYVLRKLVEAFLWTVIECIIALSGNSKPIVQTLRKDLMSAVQLNLRVLEGMTLYLSSIWRIFVLAQQLWLKQVNPSAKDWKATLTSTANIMCSVVMVLVDDTNETVSHLAYTVALGLASLLMAEMTNAVQLDAIVGALQDVNENRLSKFELALLLVKIQEIMLDDDIQYNFVEHFFTKDDFDVYADPLEPPESEDPREIYLHHFPDLPAAWANKYGHDGQGEYGEGYAGRARKIDAGRLARKELDALEDDVDRELVKLAAAEGRMAKVALDDAEWLAGRVVALLGFVIGLPVAMALGFGFELAAVAGFGAGAIACVLSWVVKLATATEQAAVSLIAAAEAAAERAAGSVDKLVKMAVKAAEGEVISAEADVAAEAANLAAAAEKEAKEVALSMQKAAAEAAGDIADVETALANQVAAGEKAASAAEKSLQMAAKAAVGEVTAAEAATAARIAAVELAAEKGAWDAAAAARANLSAGERAISEQVNAVASASERAAVAAEKAAELAAKAAEGAISQAEADAAKKVAAIHAKALQAARIAAQGVKDAVTATVKDVQAAKKAVSDQADALAKASERAASAAKKSADTYAKAAAKAVSSAEASAAAYEAAKEAAVLKVVRNVSEAMKKAAAEANGNVAAAEKVIGAQAAAVALATEKAAKAAENAADMAAKAAAGKVSAAEAAVAAKTAAVEAAAVKAARDAAIGSQKAVAAAAGKMSSEFVKAEAAAKKAADAAEKSAEMTAKAVAGDVSAAEAAAAARAAALEAAVEQDARRTAAAAAAAAAGEVEAANAAAKAAAREAELAAREAEAAAAGGVAVAAGGIEAWAASVKSKAEKAEKESR